MCTKLLILSIFLQFIFAKEQIIQTNVKLNSKKKQDDPKTIKINEENIPVIEIKGEGKPMSAAQIRALEEEAEGKPLDIKIKKTWTPKQCLRSAKRLDLVTFHYKGYYEDGKKFDQTYGKEPVTIQLGVGMTIPGLDKGLRGVCDNELRKITIPWRLSRRRKSKVWKNVPKEEHWISFDMIKFSDKMKKDYGKTLPNSDIDKVLAAEYFIKYFDKNGDQKVNSKEYESKMEMDIKIMKNKASPSENGKSKIKKSRKRDPGLAWILDFDNDGWTTDDELDTAPEILAMDPAKAGTFLEQQRQNSSYHLKTEL
uniref:peptidylprolyl isomerase n=1 Tax=Romanomermis culicivorax TaxID=13658 RepID=A0A915HVU0_ROMCU